jgi:hypothetical protein
MANRKWTKGQTTPSPKEEEQTTPSSKEEEQCVMPLTYFNYMVVVSFIGGEP